MRNEVTKKLKTGQRVTVPDSYIMFRSCGAEGSATPRMACANRDTLPGREVRDTWRTTRDGRRTPESLPKHAEQVSSPASSAQLHLDDVCWPTLRALRGDGLVEGRLEVRRSVAARGLRLRQADCGFTVG